MCKDIITGMIKKLYKGGLITLEIRTDGSLKHSYESVCDIELAEVTEEYREDGTWIISVKVPNTEDNVDLQNNVIKTILHHNAVHEYCVKYDKYLFSIPSDIFIAKSICSMAPGRLTICEGTASHLCNIDEEDKPYSWLSVQVDNEHYGVDCLHNYTPTFLNVFNFRVDGITIRGLSDCRVIRTDSSVEFGAVKKLVDYYIRLILYNVNGGEFYDECLMKNKGCAVFYNGISLGIIFKVGEKEFFAHMLTLDAPTVELLDLAYKTIYLDYRTGMYKKEFAELAMRLVDSSEQ